MRVALKAYGESGILAYDLSEKERASLCRELLKDRPTDCLEYVEGFDAVLFAFKHPTAMSVLAKWLKRIPVAKVKASKSKVHTVPVVYDGPDLKSVARQTGLGADELIEIHSSAVYTVRMMGFSPGFPYLDGLDPRLQLPRKDSPRKRIEPGTVAIGGPHAGIYSVASPGGWHLLGRTDLQLFDTIAAKGISPAPKQVFRFSPGERLRFQAVESGLSRSGGQVENPPSSGQNLPPEGGTPTKSCLEILSPGSGLSLQDAGRSGWMRYGVPPGGAMDRHAMRAANQLLGNKPNAPVLEILLQGASLKVCQDTWVALAGADSCAAVASWTAVEVKAGDVLEFSRKGKGLFACLAVPGGFTADSWLGSVSVDPRNGLGRRLQKGDRLVASSSQANISTDGIARRILIEEERLDYAKTEHFSLLPGPQFETFSDAARKRLVASDWSVSSHSDRTGYRLAGAELKVPHSIPSEPVLPGSFQVPGNGQPIITMVDGPTVGGYPKIAILKDTDRDRLAQCAPGTQLSFTWATS